MSDDDRTIISRGTSPVDDEATRITRDTIVDDDATTITREPVVDYEATVVSRGVAAGDLDDRTVVSSGRRDLDDRTTVSAGRSKPTDDATQVSRKGGPAVDEETAVTDDRHGQQRGPRSSTPAPGRLSGGRVAFVPGDTVERYPVRERTPVVDNVVRTVIPAPSSPARQTRNTAAIETAVKRRTTRRGIGVVVAIVGVTLLALLIVGGVIAFLFLS